MNHATKSLRFPGGDLTDLAIMGRAGLWFATATTTPVPASAYVELDLPGSEESLIADFHALLIVRAVTRARSLLRKT